MSEVHAVESAAVHHAGGVVPVRKGEKYDQDHPLVREHPALFGLQVKRGRLSPVEQATANPGEYRNLP